MSGGIKSIISVVNGEVIPKPGYIALAAAVISIAAKEILYQATVKVGKEVNSPVVVANAWHHRSDALSSIGALLGIGGAIILGDKWTVLDPIASCCISIAIIVIAVKMALPSLSELLETSLPEDIEAEIVRTASEISGVRDIHELKTRRNGISFIIDAPTLGGLKPNKTVIYRLLERTGTDPKKTLFIGDRIDKDGGSAQAVGATFWNVSI